MFIQLRKEWGDGDDSRALIGLVLEQQGFEDYDVTVTFGEKDAPRDEIKRKAGRIVIPVQGRNFKREPLDPVEHKDLIAAGKTHRALYDINLRVELPHDLRGPKNLDNRLLWLLDRKQYMLSRLNASHAVHDQVALVRLQSEYIGAMQHFQALYDRWSRYNGEPLAMADYSASGQLTWAQSNNFSGASTWASGVSVAFSFSEYSTGTHGSTVDGNAQDDAVQADDDGDDEGAVVTIHGSPTTGSSVTNATTGISSGGDNIGACYAISDTDQSEITTTGFPATATSSAANPTVSPTTATDDLVICQYIGFTFDSNPPSYTANAGDSVVQATISNGEFGYTAYEKATGASTTVGVTFASEGNFEALAAGVVPTAEAASSPVAIITQEMG